MIGRFAFRIYLSFCLIQAIVFTLSKVDTLNTWLWIWLLGWMPATALAIVALLLCDFIVFCMKGAIKTHLSSRKR